MSQASYSKMIQNLVWAAGYNLVAIPLAAGALAWAGIILPPAVGAVLMTVSTIVVATTLSSSVALTFALTPDGASAAWRQGN